MEGATKSTRLGKGIELDVVTQAMQNTEVLANHKNEVRTSSHRYIDHHEQNRLDDCRGAHRLMD